MMNRKIIIKRGLQLTMAGLLIGAAVIIYLFNMPHRNIQNKEADYTLNVSDLVNEYLKDSDKANQKYLANDGNSKILAIRGVVNKISEDYTGNKVIILKKKNEPAGVKATFTKESNTHITQLKIGDQVVIKGVITSGASYDEDLEMYEHVTLAKSDIVLKE